MGKNITILDMCLDKEELCICWKRAYGEPYQIFSAWSSVYHYTWSAAFQTKTAENNQIWFM